MTSETATVDSSILVSEPKSEVVGNIDSTLVSVGDDPAAFTRESREPSSSEPSDDIEACDSMRMYADELTQGIDPTENVDDVMSEKSLDEGRKDDPLTVQIDSMGVCKTSSAVEPRLSPRVTLITVNEKDIVDEKRFPIKVECQLEESKTPLTGAEPLEVADENTHVSSAQVPTIEAKPEEPTIEPKQALESEEAKEPNTEVYEAKAVEKPLPPAKKDEDPSHAEVKGFTDLQFKEVVKSVEEARSKDDEVLDEPEPQKVSEPSKEETLIVGAEAPSAGSAPPPTREMNAQDPEKEKVIINEVTSSDAPNISTKPSTKKGSHDNVHATFKPSKFLKKFAQKHHTEDHDSKQDNESVRVAESEQESAMEVFEAKEETQSTAEVRAPELEKYDAETKANATTNKLAMVKGTLSSTQKSFKRPKFMRKFSAKDAEGHEPKADVASDANKSQQTPDDEAQESMRENDSVQALEIDPESAKEALEGNDENASNSGVFASKPDKTIDMTVEPKANATAMKAAKVKEALSSTHKSFKKPKFLKKFSSKETEGREPKIMKKVFIKKPKEDVPKENTDEDKTERGVVQEAALEETPMIGEEAKESSQEKEQVSTMDTKSSESMAETPVDNEISEELEQTVTEERKDTVQMITTVTSEISAILGNQSGCEEHNDSIKSSQTSSSKPVIVESVIENKSQHEPSKSTVEDNPEATTFLGFSISNFTENLFCKTEQYLGDFSSICAPRSAVETSEKGNDMANSNEWTTEKFTSLCAPKHILNTDEGAPEAPKTEVGRWNPERFNSLCAPISTSGADDRAFEAPKTEPNSNEGYLGDLTSLCGPKATAETGSLPDAEFKGVAATVTETPDQSPGFHEITEKKDAAENYLDKNVSAECKSPEETSVVEVPLANAKDETNTEDEAVSNDEEPKELKVEESVAEEIKFELIKSTAQNPSSEHAETETLVHESNVELTTDDLCKLEEPSTDIFNENEEAKLNLITTADNSTSQEKPIESTYAESTTSETPTTEFNTAESTIAEFSLTSSETTEAARSAEAEKPGAEEVTASEKGSTMTQKASLFKRLGRGRAQPTTLKTDCPESVDTNISVSPSKRGKFKFLVSKKK
mmetsp:Transcript_13746/g.29023  ORF Transcript_13746/g.29023 Transcript_13746/m.29023 type:complete len:1109 (+) Transcript_13746:137-3463(+)|eukprot:CAMPEP_0171345430 /NCGR_PEP_ID=MMETSP0878-20121228/21561_1 /TAXON_ID=67004 /ORGANISM="Thalassiosira weissflogii, Strain CCMP1336" /LENGTH=1108 /DNA_ID=CAMNT_0011848833 /DNA_START=80 /DNA_END=3406 /DNA_ORIENTATION=+